MARRKRQRIAASVQNVQAASGASTKAKSVPAGVKVIAVLAWLAAAALILLALLFFAGAGFAEDILKLAQLQPDSEELSGMSPEILVGVFASIAVLFLVLGILYVFVGRGLWKGRTWARIVAIVLAVIGILWSLYSIKAGPVSSVFWIIAYGAIGSYLWFNKDVKAAFAREG